MPCTVAVYIAPEPLVHPKEESAAAHVPIVVVQDNVVQIASKREDPAVAFQFDACFCSLPSIDLAQQAGAAGANAGIKVGDGKFATSPTKAASPGRNPTDDAVAAFSDLYTRCITPLLFGGFGDHTQHSLALIYGTVKTGRLSLAIGHPTTWALKKRDSGAGSSPRATKNGGVRKRGEEDDDEDDDLVMSPDASASTLEDSMGPATISAAIVNANGKSKSAIVQRGSMVSKAIWDLLAPSLGQVVQQKNNPAGLSALPSVDVECQELLPGSVSFFGGGQQRAAAYHGGKGPSGNRVAGIEGEWAPVLDRPESISLASLASLLPGGGGGSSDATNTEDLYHTPVRGTTKKSTSYASSTVGGGSGDDNMALLEDALADRIMSVLRTVHTARKALAMDKGRYLGHCVLTVTCRAKKLALHVVAASMQPSSAAQLSTLSIILRDLRNRIQAAATTTSAANPAGGAAVNAGPRGGGNDASNPWASVIGKSWHGPINRVNISIIGCLSAFADAARASVSSLRFLDHVSRIDCRRVLKQLSPVQLWNQVAIYKMAAFAAPKAIVAAAASPPRKSQLLIPTAPVTDDASAPRGRLTARTGPTPSFAKVAPTEGAAVVHPNGVNSAPGGTRRDTAVAVAVPTGVKRTIVRTQFINGRAVSTTTEVLSPTGRMVKSTTTRTVEVEELKSPLGGPTSPKYRDPLMGHDAAAPPNPPARGGPTAPRGSNAAAIVSTTTATATEVKKSKKRPPPLTDVPGTNATAAPPEKKVTKAVTSDSDEEFNKLLASSDDEAEEKAAATKKQPNAVVIPPSVVPAVQETPKTEKVMSTSSPTKSKPKKETKPSGKAAPATNVSVAAAAPQPPSAVPSGASANPRNSIVPGTNKLTAAFNQAVEKRLKAIIKNESEARRMVTTIEYVEWESLMLKCSNSHTKALASMPQQQHIAPVSPSQGPIPSMVSPTSHVSPMSLKSPAMDTAASLSPRGPSVQSVGTLATTARSTADPEASPAPGKRTSVVTLPLQPGDEPRSLRGIEPAPSIGSRRSSSRGSLNSRDSWESDTEEPTSKQGAAAVAPVAPPVLTKKTSIVGPAAPAAEAKGPRKGSMSIERTNSLARKGSSMTGGTIATKITKLTLREAEARKAIIAFEEAARDGLKSKFEYKGIKKLSCDSPRTYNRRRSSANSSTTPPAVQSGGESVGNVTPPARSITPLSQRSPPRLISVTSSPRSSSLASSRSTRSTKSVKSSSSVGRDVDTKLKRKPSGSGRGGSKKFQGAISPPPAPPPDPPLVTSKPPSRNYDRVKPIAADGGDANVNGLMIPTVEEMTGRRHHGGEDDMADDTVEVVAKPPSAPRGGASRKQPPHGPGSKKAPPPAAAAAASPERGALFAGGEEEADVTDELTSCLAPIVQSTRSLSGTLAYQEDALGADFIADFNRISSQCEHLLMAMLKNLSTPTPASNLVLSSSNPATIIDALLRPPPKGVVLSDATFLHTVTGKLGIDEDTAEVTGQALRSLIELSSSVSSKVPTGCINASVALSVDRLKKTIAAVTLLLLWKLSGSFKFGPMVSSESFMAKACAVYGSPMVLKAILQSASYRLGKGGATEGGGAGGVASPNKNGSADNTIPEIAWEDVGKTLSGLSVVDPALEAVLEEASLSAACPAVAKKVQGVIASMHKGEPSWL